MPRVLSKLDAHMQSDLPPTLAISDLQFSYGAERVLDISQLELGVGASLAIIGPSGCGKTTLMHVIAGLLRPTSGAVRVLGQDLSQLSASAMDRFRGANMGMVFQRLLLLPALTVRENVTLAARLGRVAASQSEVDGLLDRLGVLALAQRKPQTLSVGQAQRVAIARALVHKPRLVLADEPTSALDDSRAADAIELLRHAAGSVGAALIVVTHDNRVRGRLDEELDLGASS